MLLLSDSTRKKLSSLSAAWIAFITLMPTYQAIAQEATTNNTAETFNKANQMGYSHVYGGSVTGIDGQTKTVPSLLSNISTTNSTNTAITGLGTQAAPSDLTSMYKGSGRNGIDSITTLQTVGEQKTTCNSAQACPPGDIACLQQSLSCKGIVAAVTTTATDKTDVVEKAKKLQQNVSKMDPINVVGLNNIPEANTSVCTTASVALPQQTTTKQCLHGNFYKVTGVKDSNITVLQEATPAICPKDYTLNTTTHMCEINLYTMSASCPDGYLLKSGADGKYTCYRQIIPNCSAGLDLDANKNSCDSNATPTCPTGYTYAQAWNQPTGVMTCKRQVDPICNTGYTLSSDKKYCVKTYNANATTATVYSCPTSQMTLSGTTCSCSGPMTCQQTGTYVGPPPVQPTYTYTCPSGYSGGGSSSTCSYSYAASGSTSYSCPSGGSLSGTTCYKSGSGSCSQSKSSTATQNCYTRTFTNLCGIVTRTAGPWCVNKVGDTTLYCPTVDDGSCSYAASSTSNYSCPSGGTLSGSTCTVTTTGTASSPICPSNYFWDAPKNRCTSTSTLTTYNRKYWDCGGVLQIDNTWTTDAATDYCPAKTASATATATGTQQTTYSCPTGVLNGTSCVETWNSLCPNDFEKLPGGDKCQNNVIPECGPGYTINGTYSSCNMPGVESSTCPDGYTKFLASDGNYMCQSNVTPLCVQNMGLSLNTTQNKCEGPYTGQPIRDDAQIIQDSTAYTCTPSVEMDAYYQCTVPTDYMDANKKCRTLADKTDVVTNVIGPKGRAVANNLFDFHGEKGAVGDLHYSKLVSQWCPIEPTDPNQVKWGQGTGCVQTEGNGSFLEFKFVDNTYVQVTGRMYRLGQFDTKTNGSNRVDFLDGNGNDAGFLEFTFKNGKPYVSGGVTVPGRFTITPNESCMDFSSGHKICLFNAESVYSCPLGFSEYPGLPKACSSQPYNAFSYCPDTFDLMLGASAENNKCVKIPTPNLANNNCVSNYATCPDGTFLNGGRCTGVNEMNKGDDCELLPTVASAIPSGTTPTEKVYLCKIGTLDECATVEDATCTIKSDTCIDTVTIAGSSLNGKCAMNQRTLECTTAGLNLSSTSCSFQPMCFNGNCFTPPGTQCQGKTVETTKTEKESCMVTKQVEFRQCSLVETKNAQQKVIGFTDGSDCANINTQGTSAVCTQIPPTFDPSAANGAHEPGRYPSKLTYSCLLPGLDECSVISAKPDRALSGSACNEYQCLDPLPLSTSPIEQSGVNATSIVGSVSNGAVPMPGLDRNTCSNKGACINEERTYSYSVTSQTPGDECTTDLSQVLVSMEAGRQAGNYIDPNSVKIFGGEFSRCDRRAVSVGGSNLGSKSCCNISSPDPKSNAELMGSPLMQGYSLLGSAVAAGSSYMYDYMMSSQKFVTAAQELWAAGALTDNMAQQGLNVAQSSAESLANFNFSPSVSIVPGFSIGYGAVNAGGAAVGTTISSGSAALGAGTTTTVVAGTGSVATTTTVAGVSTTTTTTAIGNTGFNFSYNPTMLYITAAMMAYQAYQAALACDEEDYKSSTKGKAKLCYDTGTWCEKKDCSLFGCTCVKYRTGKCCFNSKLARIINQQGRPQLGLDMRACDGFTVSQIQALDWSRIDLSEFIADMLAQAQQSTTSIMGNATQTALQNKLKGSAKTNAEAGTQPRLPVSH